MSVFVDIAGVPVDEELQAVNVMVKIIRMEKKSFFIVFPFCEYVIVERK